MTLCHDNCGPDKFPELEEENTVICEQINAWLNDYKHKMKHMNIHRFNFFLYIVLNEYNKIKTEGLYELFNNQLSKFPSKKRTYSEMVEENNDDE